jgi:hypothetical protein
MKMEAARSSEMSATIYQSTWRHITPQYLNLNQGRHDNLETRVLFVPFHGRMKQSSCKIKKTAKQTSVIFTI